ncbi:MAG: right-handed parallel beta-helix repeat-containing protein [Planctomycetes bacterium]|nr:right-handed parallel beta-helix repeat-containing protein [Planctomycetota bacterium]
MRWIFALLLLPALARAETYKAGTWDYTRVLKQLEPGDTMILEEGDYPGMPEIRLKGRPDAWIVIRGADGGERPRILAQEDRNTIEIRDSCYVAIENLTLDGRDRGGAFAVSASEKPSHHIRIENCMIVGHGYDQSQVAISTKAPTWNWVIRRNTVVAAGTGAYLGDSDGSEPFVGGLIEYNLFLDARGYNMQIKHQNPRDVSKIPGLPTTPQKTIIRHNVFLKGELENDSGERPNLLIGALPTRGPGSEDSYEVYGNLFYHNHRESLLQAEGRVSIHDNVFVDCTGDGIHLQNHYGKLQRAYVYNNTFFGVETAIRFVHPATDDHLVAGNLMFSGQALAGAYTKESRNLHVAVANAKDYVRNPSLVLGKMDFYPLPGRCKGDPIDLSFFAHETDSGRDFNGADKGDGSYRGAYAGEGTNPGWQLDALVKGELPPAANDRTPPTASFKVGDGKGTATGLVVDLAFNAGDGVAGMGEGSQMRLSNDGRSWTEPEPFTALRRGWDLSSHGGNAEPGLKVVYARVSDAAGNWTPVLVAAVELLPAKE